MQHHHYNSFYADPFIYKISEDCVSILAEEFFFTRSKGVISLLDIVRTSGKLLNKKIILEETCHLSYPFYDEVRKTVIPESYRNGNWAEYDFDGHVVSNKRITAAFPLIDATPVVWNDVTYIFATAQPKALSELLIYYIDEKTGNYIPHPNNPVKDDIKTARCGGKCFTFEGDLYRVVQDSTRRYGESLHIMKVTELSKSKFAEELFCDIVIDSDDKYPLGVHTLNFEKDFVIIDGFREKFRPFFALYIYKIVPFINKLKKRLKWGMS